ncbi:MAG TPA: MarC family protein [Victivallales bacterium]|nr:MarC family protein [Victivallales bacterium]
MKEILSIAIMLFFIMDPLGNIPLFLSTIKTVPKKRQRIVLIRELFIALIFLLLFFFVGKYSMNLLHLSQESISIGGGIILFLMAIKMIFPQRVNDTAEVVGEPFIVPLAIPLVAGPAVMAFILLLRQSKHIPSFSSLAALLLAWLASSLILFFSTAFYKVLRERGLIAMERLMGMLLVIMSVQMLLDGISKSVK